MALYEFEGKAPQIGQGTYIHPLAALIGDVTVGDGCLIAAGAALRGDFGKIMVGNGSNVQENAVLHASPMQPIDIGDNVIIAHGALLHDAIIKKGAVVGMGAVVLHRAVVEEDAQVAAGAVVTPGFIVPARKIAMGNPAKIAKDVTDQVLEITRLGLQMYQELAGRYIKGAKRID
jgi:carbonic anhydrase/acetyltransferase-like protein (isoleucine patch superfamily)